MELIGWSVLWGVQGVESVRTLRWELEEKGLSKSAIYRAAADFRRLKEHLEQVEGRKMESAEVIEELRKIAA